MENLVIVEAPKKARTIEKLLGKEYVVASSIGHIRDLAKKGLGIDVTKNYELAYEVPADKKKVVEELRGLAKKAKNIWLASDGDREGEAIAWHLTEVLGLDVASTKRIVFHEITKSALVDAIAAPRTVNMDLVNAQQARRVLDRLVGFELSPVLWRKVRPQLSAGRVQSVAVRLLVEREREIIAFDSKPYFRVVGHFFKGGSGAGEKGVVFKAELTKRFDSEAMAREFLEVCSGASFAVSKVEEKPVKRYPAPPFTTSTLQVEAGRKLGMSVSQTMSVAQKLYEQGLITYMRTDSVNLSGQALAMCKEQIVKSYGSEYSCVKNYKTKAKGAQEAHEAIRPSYIDRQSIEGTAAEKRLYDLIWKRTVASQMVAAELDRTVIHIDRSGADKATFSATGEVLRFDGFMKLYTESSAADDDAAASGEGGDGGMLPRVAVGESMGVDLISATERFTQPPARYNEAALVSKLEELGIGRPSTIHKLFSTIGNRGYSVEQNRDGEDREYVQLTLSGGSGKLSSKVLKEKYGRERKRLAPTDIGIMVTDYLESQFSQILDYNFTADVEKEFDRIAMGEIAWDKMIDEFYKPFHELVSSAEQTQTDRSAHVRVLGRDAKSGGEVRARVGRYGPMVEIVSNVEGEKPRYAALKKGQLVESVTLEQALELFALPRAMGEFEGEELVVGVGRFGPYVRHGKGFTSLGKGDDPYTIDRERCIALVEGGRAAKAASSAPLRVFDEDADMVVKSGRYGPYIAYKGKNYRLPKGCDGATMSYADAQGVIAKSKK